MPGDGLCDGREICAVKKEERPFDDEINALAFCDPSTRRVFHLLNMLPETLCPKSLILDLLQFIAMTAGFRYCDS